MRTKSEATSTTPIAARVMFLERNPAAVRVIDDNLYSLGIGNRGKVVRGRVSKSLQVYSADATIVFLDPPYDDDDEYAETLDWLGPDVWFAHGVHIDQTEIEQFASRLRTRPLNMMADDVEDFARRWPAAFMAAAVGLGLLAGRFLVSSASRPSTPSMTPPARRPSTAMGGTVGSAHHDSGAVGGSVPGGVSAGYGNNGTRGIH